MMKKILAVLFIGIFVAGIAYAEYASDDVAVQDLSVLRKKLSRVKREMDLLIKDMMASAPNSSDAALKDTAGEINVDVLKNDKSVIVKADLPGMEKDKISVTLERSRFLKIAGSREVVKSQSSPGMVRQERFSGNFEKTVELPCEVENSGINAAYKDGVLEITIPKKALAKEDKVKINVK